MTIRYLSPSGANSGPGTVSPWQTFSYAEANAASGDTIIVMPGTYTQSADVEFNKQINWQCLDGFKHTAVINFNSTEFRWIFTGSVTQSNLRYTGWNGSSATNFLGMLQINDCDAVFNEPKFDTNNLTNRYKALVMINSSQQNNSPVLNKPVLVSNTATADFSGLIMIRSANVGTGIPAINNMVMGQSGSPNTISDVSSGEMSGIMLFDSASALINGGSIGYNVSTADYYGSMIRLNYSGTIPGDNLQLANNVTIKNISFVSNDCSGDGKILKSNSVTCIGASKWSGGLSISNNFFNSNVARNTNNPEACIRLAACLSAVNISGNEFWGNSATGLAGSDGTSCIKIYRGTQAKISKNRFIGNTLAVAKGATIDVHAGTTFPGYFSGLRDTVAIISDCVFARNVCTGAAAGSYQAGAISVTAAPTADEKAICHASRITTHLNSVATAGGITNYGNDFLTETPVTGGETTFTIDSAICRSVFPAYKENAGTTLSITNSSLDKTHFKNGIGNVCTTDSFLSTTLTALTQDDSRSPSGGFYNFRSIVRFSASTNAALHNKKSSKIRVKLQAATAQEAVISGVAVGLRGATSEFAAAPKRVTWLNGNNGVTIPANQSIWSDWIDFEWDSNVTSYDLMVSVAQVGASTNIKRNTTGGLQIYNSLNAGIDDSQNINVTGTYTGAANYLYIADIQIANGNGNITFYDAANDDYRVLSSDLDITLGAKLGGSGSGSGLYLEIAPGINYPL